MQLEIKQLFQLIRDPMLADFERLLTAELVNQADKSILYDYHYQHYMFTTLKRMEIQHEYLIHEAIEINSAAALTLLLKKGANLLQRQKYERTKYKRNDKNQLVVSQKNYVSGTALYRVTCTENPELIQITFNYICDHGLYHQDPDYIEFLVTHLPTVDRRKFQISYLRIDVGNPLPDQFEDAQEYKKYLSDLGFDISMFFFFRTDYIDYFTDSTKPENEKLLQHALKVCKFTLDELMALYQAMSSEKLRWVLWSFNPEVDPLLSAQMREALEEDDLVKTPPTRKRALSCDVFFDEPKEESAENNNHNAAEVSQQQYAIQPHHIKEYEFQTTRIATLKAKIADLTQMKKTAKTTKELAIATRSLEFSQKTLTENLYYLSLQSKESEDKKDFNPKF